LKIGVVFLISGFYLVYRTAYMVNLDEEESEEIYKAYKKRKNNKPIKLKKKKYTIKEVLYYIVNKLIQYSYI
jgi:hypothetical protein